MAVTQHARPARDPSPSVRLPARQLYYGAMPLELWTNPRISRTARDVFAWTFLIHEDFGAKESRRTAAWVGKKADLHERTVRDCWDILEAEGFMAREREGDKWVSRLTYELPPRLELDADDPVYRGSRLGDKTSTHAAPLVPEPKPLPKSASNRIPRSGRDRILGSGRSASKRIPGSGGDRVPGSGPSIERTLSPKTTTTTLNPTPRAEPSPVGSSSSFLPLSDEETGPSGPSTAPEALGSPQSDRRGQDAQTPAPEPGRPSWEALALSRMAQAWPDAPSRHLEAWLKNAGDRWRLLYKGKGEDDPGEAEGAAVAGLVVEYAALMKCDPKLVWRYCEGPLAQWANNGWNAKDVEAEVDMFRPRTKAEPAAAAAEPPAPPLAKSAEWKAWEDRLRNAWRIKDPALQEAEREEAQARCSAFEAAALAAQKEAGGEVYRHTLPPARS